ncbi:MAG: hypothetical protein HC854_00875 [Flavobacterium sp.]|nr:hypothetical protein [Flavobacterium sp.]
MIKKILYILLTVLLLACKDKPKKEVIDNSLIKNSVTKEIVRPLLPEHLELLKTV